MTELAYMNSSSTPKLEDIAVKIDGPIPEGSPDWIPGLLPLQGALVIAGETNIGKSTVCLEVASTLITGEPLWGSDRLVPAKLAKKVLYVLGEHNALVLMRLNNKLGISMNGKAWLLGPEHLGYDKYLVSGGRPNLQGINKLRRWAEGADLIVFDPLGSFVVGADSENDNSQMRQAIETMTNISYEVGASTIILAHMGKPYVDRNGQEHVKRSYAIRGASAVEDASTNIFYLGRCQGQSAAAADSKHVLELYRRKYKGEAPESIMLRKDPETLRHTVLDADRPFVDAQRIATQSCYAKFQLEFPEMELGDLVRMVSIARGVSRATVYNHLRRTDEEHPSF